MADENAKPQTPEIEDNLAGENILLVTHPVLMRQHPGGSLLIAFGLVLGLLGLIMGIAGREWLGLESGWLMIVGGVLAAGAAAMFVWYWIQTRTRRLTITNERTLLEVGLVSRETSEVRHEDVRNIQVDQTAFERILSFGDLAISSSGQDTFEISIPKIPRPNDVAAIIRRYQ